MGFRCPACSEDFGTDEEALTVHITKEHKGTGMLLKTLLQKGLEKEKCNN